MINILLDLNNQENLYSEEAIKRLCSAFLKHLDLGHVELSVVFMNAEQISAINGRFRGVEVPTDVLAFRQIDADDPEHFRKLLMDEMTHGLPVLGDVVVCAEEVKKNADITGTDINRGLIEVLAHGILHLTGWVHHEFGGSDMEAEQKKMVESVLKVGVHDGIYEIVKS